MQYQLRKSEDKKKVAAMHTLCMPWDEIDTRGQCWLMYDEYEEPVGFCSARQVNGNTVFLSRAGVQRRARGNGLQRRMINARVQWARSLGVDCVITYTVYDNHSSISNLLKSGFRFYNPSWRWAGNVHYFRRDI